MAFMPLNPILGLRILPGNPKPGCCFICNKPNHWKYLCLILCCTRLLVQPSQPAAVSPYNAEAEADKIRLEIFINILEVKGGMVGVCIRMLHGKVTTYI